MAQNCTRNCHIVQTSQTRIVAENQKNACYFSQLEPEAIQIGCQNNNTTIFSVHLVFFIGDCFSGDFLRLTDIKWTFCRTADQVYSWDITTNTLELTGTLF
jgi:hypothetical protein